MKKLMISLSFLFAFSANAAVKVYFENAKFPNQQMIEKQNFGIPAGASTVFIKSSISIPNSTAAVTVTSFQNQPDVPRNLKIVPFGSTADVAACTVTVTGANYHGETITETFAFTANQSAATTGNKAFKSVSSVVFPIHCADSPFHARFEINVGEKIGLNKCLDTSGDWLHSSLSGTYEASRATLAVDADEVEKNTADFSGTMNGSNVFRGYFMQNYRCHP